MHDDDGPVALIAFAEIMIIQELSFRRDRDG
jgi:hypothetical protein